jgi:hypothetical protein
MHKKQNSALCHIIREMPHGLSGNFVSSFYESPDSSIWVGTDGNGLNRLSGNKNDFLELKKNIPNRTTLQNKYATTLLVMMQTTYGFSNFYHGTLSL